MPSRVNKREVLALTSVERFNGLAQIALSDVFACAQPSKHNKNRKVLSFMNNLLEVSSPLWLVVATFALPFILGNVSLFLSNLRNALRRKKQKSARETATSLFSVGKKAVGMGVVFAGFLLAIPPETARSAEPTITDAYSAYSYYYSESRKVYLDATQEVWTREEIYRRPSYNATWSTGKLFSTTEISGGYRSSYRSRSGNTYRRLSPYPRGALPYALRGTSTTHYPLDRPHLAMVEITEYARCKVQADWENPPFITLQYPNEEEDYQGGSRFDIHGSIKTELECTLNYSEDYGSRKRRVTVRYEEKSKKPFGKIYRWMPRHSVLIDKNAYIAVDAVSL